MNEFAVFPLIKVSADFIKVCLHKNGNTRVKHTELYIQHLLKGVWFLAGSLITGFTHLFTKIKKDRAFQK